jgi:hypothetical protein
LIEKYAENEGVKIGRGIGRGIVSESKKQKGKGKKVGGDSVQRTADRTLNAPRFIYCILYSVSCILICICVYLRIFL